MEPDPKGPEEQTTGADIRAWRESQDLSLYLVGDLLGVSQATLSRYERGRESLPYAIACAFRALSQQQRAAG